MVIITHVHLDHVSGIITKSGDHVFPNAKYVIVDDELAYWMLTTKLIHSMRRARECRPKTFTN